MAPFKKNASSLPLPRKIQLYFSVTSSVKLFHSVVLWQFAQISIVAFTNFFVLMYVSVSHTIETGQEQRPCHLLHKIQRVVGSNKCLLIQYMIQVSSYRLIFQKWDNANIMNIYFPNIFLPLPLLKNTQLFWGGHLPLFCISKWFRENWIMSPCPHVPMSPAARQGRNQLRSSTAHLALAKVWFQDWPVTLMGLARVTLSTPVWMLGEKYFYCFSLSSSDSLWAWTKYPEKLLVAILLPQREPALNWSWQFRKQTREKEPKSLVT